MFLTEYTPVVYSIGVFIEDEFFTWYSCVLIIAASKITLRALFFLARWIELKTWIKLEILVILLKICYSDMSL
jgi:hypothetical protein